MIPSDWQTDFGMARNSSHLLGLNSNPKLLTEVVYFTGKQIYLDALTEVLNTIIYFKLIR